MVPADPALDESTARPDEDDERAFFRAIAEGLADDAAGRIMSTQDLEAELERRLGPIAWRWSGGGPGLGDSCCQETPAEPGDWHAGSVAATAPKKHDPAKPVATREELEELLLAGLASGEPRSVTDEDWERLYERALAGMELRKSG